MPKSTDSTSKVLLKKKNCYFLTGALVCEQTNNAGPLRTTLPNYTRFQKPAATTPLQRPGTLSSDAFKVDSELKTDKSLDTSCMPRLTLADSLHNLPYSLDECYRALDLKLRNWDLPCPVMGS